jgi:mRNA interferase MazF
MEMKRGDVVTIALPGDYGKPRPALVVQADAFEALPSVTVLRLTSELHDWPLFRITLTPGQRNGLRATSQVMIDSCPSRAASTPTGRRDRPASCGARST